MKAHRSTLVALALTLIAGACGGSDDDDGGATSDPSVTAAPDANAEGGAEIDHVALGLWDDGPCDESIPPLHLFEPRPRIDRMGSGQRR